MIPGKAEKRGEPNRCSGAELPNLCQIVPDLSRILPETNTVLPSITLTQARLAITGEHQFVGTERRLSIRQLG